MVNAAIFVEVRKSDREGRGARIEREVVDETGKVVAYARVVDIPAAEHRTRSDLYQRDTTNEDGHFRLPGLNGGKYMALAFDELQDNVSAPEFLNAYEDRGENVQLRCSNKRCLDGDQRSLGSTVDRFSSAV